jgi:hypothetical protein
MSVLDGGELGWPDGGFPEPEETRLLERLIDAMAFTHSSGVHHRLAAIGAEVRAWRLSAQTFARARPCLGRGKTSVADMNNGTPAMARPT